MFLRIPYYPVSFEEEHSSHYSESSYVAEAILVCRTHFTEGISSSSTILVGGSEGSCPRWFIRVDRVWHINAMPIRLEFPLRYPVLLIDNDYLKQVQINVKTSKTNASRSKRICYVLACLTCVLPMSEDMQTGDEGQCTDIHTLQHVQPQAVTISSGERSCPKPASGSTSSSLTMCDYLTTNWEEQEEERQEKGSISCSCIAKCRCLADFDVTLILIENAIARRDDFNFWASFSSLLHLRRLFRLRSEDTYGGRSQLPGKDLSRLYSGELGSREYDFEGVIPTAIYRNKTTRQNYEGLIQVSNVPGITESSVKDPKDESRGRPLESPLVSSRRLHLQVCGRKRGDGNRKRVVQSVSKDRRKVYGSFGKWNEWWTRLVIMVAVWTCAGKCLGRVHAHEESICQMYNITADQVCDSMEFRSEISALDDLCKCRIINGHLHFVFQKQGDNETVTRLNQYSFPGLREITHYLLVSRVSNLTTLKNLFPNLTVIRGDVLFRNYALVIYNVPDLMDVGLVNLTVILRGSVRIARNPQLCYANTVDWNSITVGRFAENYINRNRRDGCEECPKSLKCHESKPCGSPRCWGKDDCQSVCGQKCFGGCDGDDCCHRECIGGCSRPNDPTACHACRKLLENGRCVSSCSKDKYKVLDFRCEDRSFCVKNSKISRGYWEGYVIKDDTQECVRGCLSGYNETRIQEKRRTISVCQPCPEGSCPKYCPGGYVRSVGEAQWFRACKIVEGSIIIHISGGEDIERELEENLGGIEVVTGYVKIFRSNITSLNFLRSLNRIGGEHFIRSIYSLEILENANLQSLWNWTERDPDFTIDRGQVFAKSNPKLCLHHIDKLIEKTKIGWPLETDISSTSNGHKVPCNVRPLKARMLPPSLYGTLKVEVTNDLPSDTNYYHYREAEKNISLYESEKPCSDQGWSIMEQRITNTAKGKRIIFKIINLQPYTRYAVYVKTYPLGTSPEVVTQSEIMYAETMSFNPTEPVSLQSMSLDSSSLQIWFKPPRHPNGKIDHYLINLTLLKDIPKISPDLEFCKKNTQIYVDNKMRLNWKKSQDSTLMTPKFLEEVKGRQDLDGEYDETCQATATPSCCACRGSTEGADQEVIGQIQFEDFIMDNIYVKKSTRSREHRDDEPSNPQHDDEEDFETEPYLEYATDEYDSAPTGRPRIRSFERDGDNSRIGSSSTTDYMDHNENLTQLEVRDPDDSTVLLSQVQMTNETSLRVNNLHHFALYSVVVVACQKPEPENNRKLCSSVPARIAAFTKPSESADMIVEGSLQVLPISERNAVQVTWEPPKSPNGGIVAYLINLELPGRAAIYKCVSSQEFEARNRWVELSNLSPGNYSISVKVRSKARYGNFSSPVSFPILDEEEQSQFYRVVITLLLVGAGILMVAVIRWSVRRYRARYTMPDTLEKMDINPYYRGAYHEREEVERLQCDRWSHDSNVPALNTAL